MTYRLSFKKINYKPKFDKSTSSTLKYLNHNIIFQNLKLCPLCIIVCIPNMNNSIKTFVKKSFNILKQTVCKIIILNID